MHPLMPKTCRAALDRKAEGGKSLHDSFLLQLFVFCLRHLEDRYVGISIFPEGEEVFVSGQRPDAGSIGICALRISRLQRVCPRNTKPR
jgi:hypothetical protein